jgi:hypothetical protein
LLTSQLNAAGQTRAGAGGVIGYEVCLKISSTSASAPATRPIQHHAPSSPGRARPNTLSPVERSLSTSSKARGTTVP